MRNYISLIILAVILCVFLSGCGKSEKTVGLVVTIEQGDSEKYSEDKESLNYFYSVMNEEQRKIYSIYDNLMEHFNEDDYSCEIRFSADLYDEATFTDIFRTVYIGYYRDHPECYPLSMDAVDEEMILVSSWLDEKKNEYCFSFIQGKKYKDYDKELKEMETAADEFLKDIDLNAGDREVALAIHDKLISQVEYSEITNYGKEENSIIDYSRCAYGALVQDNNGERNAVCVGYSAAYQYLLKKAGIKCTTISGYGVMVKSDGTYGKGDYHIWNAACIDDSWYEFDLTVDDMGPNDLDISDEKFREIHRDINEETRHNYDRLFFMISSEEMKDRKTEFPYTFEDGTTKNVYIRYKHFRDDELEENGIEVLLRQKFEMPLTEMYPDT